jgi:hypothetical protein
MRKRSEYDSYNGYDACFGPNELTKGGLPVPVERALSLRNGEICASPTDGGKPLSREFGQMTKREVMNNDDDLYR